MGDNLVFGFNTGMANSNEQIGDLINVGREPQIGTRRNSARCAKFLSTVSS
jgi:hypothetical protein